MDRLLARVLLACCLVLSFQSQASEKDWFFKPYVGGDVGVQRMRWEEGFGDFHFREHYPYMNLNLGVMLHKYVGIELGYEHMFERERTQYYGDIVPVLGFMGLINSGNQAFISSAENNGFNLSLLLKYPTSKSTDLFALFGAAWDRLKVSTFLIQNTDLGSNVVHRPLFWESDRKAIARVAFGVRHMITDNLGGRIMYIWENTSKLDARHFPAADFVLPAGAIIAGDSLYAKPKNSHIVTAGLFYQSDWY